MLPSACCSLASAAARSIGARVALPADDVSTSELGLVNDVSNIDSVCVADGSRRGLGCHAIRRPDVGDRLVLPGRGDGGRFVVGERRHSEIGSG